MSSSRYRFCKWLVEELKNHSTLTLEEIKNNWKDNRQLSSGEELDTRFFHRCKNTLKEDFGIIIACKGRGDYPYYIQNPEILSDSHLAEWMLDSLAIGEKLRACASLKNRICLEPIPSGGKVLDIVTDSMIKEKKLGFDYQRYGTFTPKHCELGVCCLRLYHQRWYLLGEFDDHKRYSYALDRMKDPMVTNEAFEMDLSFDADEYFKDYYGIFNSGREVTSIVFRAFGDEPYYLRDLQVHWSQHEIGCGDGYSDFVIDVRPNNELLAFFLSRKNRLKVLSPLSYVKEIEDAVNGIKNNYESVITN